MSYEEDEDGNLSSFGSEPSMGEGDEEYKVSDDIYNDSSAGSGVSTVENDDEEEDDETQENGTLSKDSSKSSSAKSKISLKREVGYLCEDEEESQSSPTDRKKRSQKTKSQVIKVKPTGNKKYKSTKFQTKPTKKSSKKRFKSESYDETSDSCTDNMFGIICQPTPLTDAFMKDVPSSNQTVEPSPEKRMLAGSNSNESSKNAKRLNKNKIVIGELIPSVNKVDPDSPPQEVEIESDFKIKDLLLVKKEEGHIKLEIKDEIDKSYDEENEKFSIKDNLSDLMDCEESQQSLIEDQNIMEDNELRQSNFQNKRKRTKRKYYGDDDNPLYSPETKKQSTLSDAKNNKNWQEKTSVPAEALLKIDDTQTPVNTRKTRGRPPKNKVIPVAEINEESKNNHLSDVQDMYGKDTNMEDMTEKDPVFFLADYLNSHQSVFDDSFFQNILPVVSEMLMLCMDELTELLARNKKANNFTSEELRQQEVKLAIKYFCSTVLTYSEKFFPNFNSVMYKINKSKTKKGLIIALVFFLANSLWVKAPKFTGQIHTLRKMLMCMFQLKKIDNPSFMAVLTTPRNTFNDDLRLLVEMLLVLQKKDAIAIPTAVLPETSCNDNIEEACELIISLSISCSSGSQDTRPSSKHPNIAEQFIQILQDEKQHDFRIIKENLDHILCLMNESNLDSNSDIPENSIIESGLCNNSLDRDQVLDESPEQNQGSGLDSLFKSYLKSTNSTNDLVKDKLDVDYQGGVLSPSYITQPSRFPMPAENIDDLVKVEEVECLEDTAKLF